MRPFNVFSPSSSLTTRCGESPTVTPSQLSMLLVSLQFKRLEVLPSRVVLRVRSSTQSLTKAALAAGLGTTVPLVHVVTCDGELPPPPPPPPPGWEAAGGGIIVVGVGVAVGVSVIVGVGVGVGQFGNLSSARSWIFWPVIVHVHRVFGIQLSRLVWRCKRVRLERLPNSLGIGPVSRLVWRYN